MHPWTIGRYAQLRSSGSLTQIAVSLFSAVVLGCS